MEGEWSWTVQLGIAEEQLPLLPKTMAWVETIIDQIKTSEAPQ